MLARTGGGRQAACTADSLIRRIVILAVDDDDALAQVLDDVVVELDEIAQVDAALLGERFGFHEPRAEQLHDGGDDEDHGAENADGRKLRRPS